MESRIQIFDNPDFGEVRTTEDDGVAYFCGNDVANALGYSRPDKAVRDHCKGEPFWAPLRTKGGVQAVRFIPEGDVYRLVASSKLDGAKKFESWIYDEVLPSIRKSGGYMVATPDETPEQLMARALKVADDTLARMHAQLDEVQAANAGLVGKVLEMEPKALFADAVASSDRYILIGELAKILRQNGYPTGQNRLYRTLREDGYLMKSGDSYNRPTQRAMELGLFVVIERTIIDGKGRSKTTATTKVTGKGQQHFVNRYCPRRLDIEAAL